MSKTLLRSKSPSGAAYAVAGTGPAVLLIHGVGMRIEAWNPQIGFLSRHFRTVAVDLPGHGESAPLSTGARLADFVSWCANFIRETDIGPVSVAGHSMGAMIAGGLAASAPDLVARVALLNGVYKRTEQARDAVKARAAEIVSGHFDRTAPLARWFGRGHEFEDAYQLCRDLLADVNADGYATAYAAFADGDLEFADRWPEVQCPALFLTGNGDLNSTADMANAMAEAAPAGEALVIRDHRHMVNLTAPDIVNEALASWLARPAREVAHAF